MGKLVVLQIGDGSFEEGFSVSMQIKQEQNNLSKNSSASLSEIALTGKLPPQPEILQQYQRWQSSYRCLGQDLRLGAIPVPSNINLRQECQQAAELLQNSFNAWLDAESFRSLREKLLEQLVPAEAVQILLQTENIWLQRLPWHLWDLLDRYPQAELAISTPTYESVPKRLSSRGKVKILAILGHSTGIDTQADHALLSRLPDTEVYFLVEPQLQDISDRLWEQSWDILFFAGHSITQSGDAKGCIYLNSTESLTIEQLKHGLKQAIAGGLKLAIFNSCDGLGLARELAQLQIPYTIVMREPVPDLVAQEFLKYFLTEFAKGKSFYLAVKEARKRLEGLESQFPFATWLPLIWQHPAEIPPTWQEWTGKSPTKPNWLQVFFTSLAITSLCLGMRWLGILQPLELWAFDRLLLLRPPEEIDSRLLIVAVTEADIQAQSQRQGSLADAFLVRLLAKLEVAQPRVIGLDIYHDFPFQPDYKDLVTRLSSSQPIIFLCKGRDSKNDPEGIPPPPEVPEARVGFSDFIPDDDGALRRQLLFMDPDPASSCTTPYAFNVQLALHYLAPEEIMPQFTATEDLQLAQTVFPSLKTHTGGYQGIDARGSQILLNYRSLSSPEQIAPVVTLEQVLSDRLNPEAVKDRIVLIGVTANNSGDLWSTPYGSGTSEQVSGIFIQAHMVSQILSAVLEGRPLLWVLPQWGETLWIWSWSLAGAIIAWHFRSSTHLGIAGGAALLTLSGLCFIFLWIHGGWMPLIPSMLVLVTTMGTFVYFPVVVHPR